MPDVICETETNNKIKSASKTDEIHEGDESEKVSDPVDPSPDMMDGDGEFDEDQLEVDEAQRRSNWQCHSFIAPLQACFQLTGYPHLLRLYWILVTLPVTSCSAERALSRLRIIKNRLRSSMCDDWMKALMVIASEKNLLERISNDVIIDTYAQLSNRLKQQLIFCT